MTTLEATQRSVVRRLGPDDVQLCAAAAKSLLSSEIEDVAGHPHLRGALSDPRCYFLVALLDARPISFLSAYRFPAVDHHGFLAYLYDIAVLCEYRKQGVATELIAALKDYCRKDGVARIWVGTSSENSPAQHTFEATGARRVSETYLEYIYDLQVGEIRPTRCAT